jgi:hypothetical protein
MGDRTRFAVAFAATALFCGCQATDQVKGFVRKTGIRTPTTPDPIAFSQVPDRNKEEAIQAAKTLRLARARHKLTELRESLAKIEVELAEFERKAAISRLNEKSALFKQSQFEAIDKSGLGHKEENIAAIGKLASRAAGHESTALKDEAQATILKRRADKQRAEVEAQAKTVTDLEGAG